MIRHTERPAAGATQLILTLLTAIAMTMGVSQVATAQTADQQTCMSALVKAGAKLAKTQGKENTGCIRDAGKGKLLGLTAQECLTADRKEKVAKASAKTISTDSSRCAAPLPPYGYTGAANVNATVLADELFLVAQLFDGDLDAALLLSSSGAACQSAASKAYERIISTHAKEFSNCVKAGLKGGGITDESGIIDCVGADPKDKIDKVKGKVASTLGKKCSSGLVLSDAFPGTCSAQAGTTAELATCISAATACSSCKMLAAMTGVTAGCDSVDDGLVNGSCEECGNGFLDPSEECDDGAGNSDTTPDACRTNCTLAGCGDSVVDSGETCDEGTSTPTCDGDCTAVACGDGFANPTVGEDCDDAGESSACDTDCTVAECGDGTANIHAGEGCDDGNTTGGDGCDEECHCEPSFSGPLCQDPECPTKARVVLRARTTSDVCANNGDCSAGTCDTGLSRCVTTTDVDSGWTGIAHDSDVSDGSAGFVDLHCIGPFDGGSATPCGECLVVGLLPEADNCRCADDNTAICDEPFEADDDDCGGAICNCYAGAPLPISSGNTPACAVSRYAVDVAGTSNVDTGESELDVKLRSIVFLGENVVEPCGYCIGDITPGDGVRDGVCELGDNDGGPCDAHARHATFPPPTGGDYSLDCFPNAGKNVSGQGLRIEFIQTTAAVSLDYDIPCGFPPTAPDICACGVCSNDSQAPCSSDADCLAPGVCQALGEHSALTNQCSDGVCADVGGEEGECQTGPDLKYCDGAVRANGNGFVQCGSNADCDASDCGIPCGACTITDRQECFLDPIAGSGTASPTAPVTAAAFCVPPTGNPGINIVAGLPGPTRVINQSNVTQFCALNESVAYVPGVGDCSAGATTTTTTTSTTLPIPCSLTPVPLCNGACPPGLSCTNVGVNCSCQ